MFCEKIQTAISAGLISYCAFNAASVMASEGDTAGFYGDIALAVEPEPGFGMRNDFYFYSADGDGSVRSGQVELEADLDLTFDYLSFLYKIEKKVLGAGYAFGATFVVGKADISGEISAGPASVGFSDDKTSYGDITLVPGIFYWNNGDKLHFSQSFYIVAPVGDYDEDDLANTGLNYWTFETDFAMTYLNQETGQDYSIVIGYGYNTENEDTDYKSGNEWHIQP